MERLQKVIAANSKYSRRKAEELILEGKVRVNGDVVTELGVKVEEHDEVEVNNKVLFKQEKVYFLLNKPKGCVSTKEDERSRRTVVDMVQEKNEHKDLNIYPVGRLDYNTTGLLLLTNDGALTNILTHPRHQINKTYIAKVKGEELTKKAILDLQYGVEIDGYKTQRCKVQVMQYNFKNNTFKVKLVIHEGKNHQVKKMFEAIGGKVIELKRSEYAFLNLDGVAVGEYRELTLKEVKKLFGENANATR